MLIRLRAAGVVAAAAAGIAALALHRPGLGFASPDDPTAGVVTAAGWLAWALAGYLLVAVTVAAAGHLVCAAQAPRATGCLAARVTPAVVRRFVEAAIGATAAVALAGAVGPAAYADAGPHSHPPAISSPLDWPGLQRPSHDRSPAYDSPAARPPATPARTPSGALLTSPARRHLGPRPEIVVRAGDSLWSLTARSLGPGATAAEVAATWPRLYAANRAVIGPDPGLIHPGQRLVPPAAPSRSPR